MATAKVKCGKCNVVHEAKQVCNDLYKCSCCKTLNITESKKSYSLKEWLGFDYQSYLGAIFSVLDRDQFEILRAKTTEEINAGKFTDTEVEKLREVLDKGFNKEQSIKEIGEEINKKVKPRDLYRMKNGKIEMGKDGKPLLQFGKERRGIIISRTETTRIANKGALEHFKTQDVQEVVFVASIGDRTCVQCMELDGRIFPINQTEVQIPVHVMCRCTWINKF